jgi:hypothetical protein
LFYPRVDVSTGGMGWNPNQLTRLSESEGQRVRDLLREHGAQQTAKLLGIYDKETVYKVCAGERVSVGTAKTVRDALALLQVTP